MKLSFAFSTLFSQLLIVSKVSGNCCFLVISIKLWKIVYFGHIYMPVKYILKKNPTTWDNFCWKSVHNLSFYNNLKLLEESSKKKKKIENEMQGLQTLEILSNDT